MYLAIYELTPHTSYIIDIRKRGKPGLNGISHKFFDCYEQAKEWLIGKNGAELREYLVKDGTILLRGVEVEVDTIYNKFLTIMNCIEYIQETLPELLSMNDYLRTQLSREDIERSDILHEIEFNTFNASEGYKFSKRLKESSIVRRKIKDSILYREILNNKVNLEDINCICKKYKDMKERKYSKKGGLRENYV